jgi:hypothetical protein
MEGVSIIEGQTLKQWERRLEGIEQTQLALIKLIRQIIPAQQQSSVPDFISVENAAKKYNVSKTTIHNKINLFSKVKGRSIDRLQMGSFNLVNEVELLEALRLKGPTPGIFKTKVA